MVTVDEKISQWRRELLDLSQRNRLLNFKPSRSGTVKLVEPAADAIYKRLVEQERGFVFYRESVDQGDTSDQLVLIPPDAPLNPAEAVPSEPPQAARRSLRPDEVRADAPSADLERALYRVYLKARGSILEQGVNVLFVAFGMLEWAETATSMPSRAPLVLVPRPSAERRPSIPSNSGRTATRWRSIRRSSKSSGPSFDLTLSLTEDDFVRPLPDILVQIRSAVANRPGWSVSDDVYLGLFQFHKLSMYQDLQTYGNVARAHPVIQALAGDPGRMPDLPSDLPREDQLDTQVLPQSSFQILDADSSQMQAIVAAVRGGSFIVHGPPGTGKSQTIANIIAECLADGKTVLFVSEKAAALEVVIAAARRSRAGRLLPGTPQPSREQEDRPRRVRQGPGGSTATRTVSNR